MSIKALNDYVIIEESKLGTKKTSTGFELSESLDSESRFRKGTIVDPGQFSEILNKGDEVLYDKKAGNGSPDLDDRWRILRMGDLRAKL